MIRTLLLILGCISFIIVMGAATYEHAVVVPAWTAAVPASLAMFQGDYGLYPWHFWIPVHPITVGLLVIALIANWRTQRRNYIIAGLAGYIAVLAVTFTFFVPELLALVQTTYSATVDAELTRRAHLWETLSLVRLGFIFIVALILLLGLSKPAEDRLS